MGATLNLTPAPKSPRPTSGRYIQNLPTVQANPPANFDHKLLSAYETDNNVNPITNGGLEWPENNSGFQENGHAPLRDGISDKFYSSNESDDEFSDPLDNDAITDDFISENGFAEYESSATFVPVNVMLEDFEDIGLKLRPSHSKLKVTKSLLF
ncbi:hypothetical protein CHUAL_005309 [Chamberlinius hualienensis]